MSTQLVQSPSPNGPVSRSNGLAEENQPNYPQRKFALEDFSQHAINRGQQEINYLITVADERIVEALKQLSTAIAKLAACGQVDLSALDNAIEEASEATQNIAGPFPPGCVGPTGLRLG
ncbi:MAG TPA: hypothetical protein VN843_15375 [Anaerolineales bacterium]|nr:hypothetical protein [Anaerolineales bacterium]